MAVVASDQKIPRSIATYAPEYFTIKLKYFSSENITNNASSTLKPKSFKLNNIYRPDTNAHDPNGYDFWAGAYKYNRVIGCVCKMTWIHFDSTVDATISRCGYQVLGTDSTDRATTFDKGMEKQHFVYVGDISNGIGKQDTTLATNTIKNNTVPYKLSATYVYNPTKIADAIEDLAESNTFIAFGGAAPIPHTIDMWTCDMGGTVGKNIKYEMEMIFTVQLRELRYDNGMLVQDTT